MKAKIRLSLLQWFSVTAVFLPAAMHATVFVVAKEADGTDQQKKDACLVTTHSISGAGFTLGISDKGGGYINKLRIPALGGAAAIENIMDTMSDRYGRGGQSAFRDYVHGQKYNPTQAGFTDVAGTYCPVDDTVANKLTVLKRRVCLWHGDQDYDFIQYTDLNISDGYTPVAGSPDFDDLDETNANESDEITSEWDYMGTYEYLAAGRTLANNTTSIPTFRHYFEYTYARQPNTGGSGSGKLALRQHNKVLPPNHPGDRGGWQESVSCDDIANQYPENGPYPVGGLLSQTPYVNSMGVVSLAWTTRLDKNKWPQAIYRWYATSSGSGVTLTRENRFDSMGAGVAHAWYSKKSTTLMGRTHGVTWEDQDTGANPIVPTDVGFPLIIIGESATADTGRSIGIYLVNTVNNRKIAAEDVHGAETYTDDRRILVTVVDNPARAKSQANEVMELLGFKTYLTGVLDPSRLPAGTVDEKMRGEIYIFFGTPNEILANARATAAFEALP